MMRRRACLLALPMSLTAPAVAAAPTGFAVERFEPSERGSQWFVLDSINIDGGTRLAAGLVAGYQHRPLAIYEQNGDVRAAIVEHTLTTHLGASLVLWKRVRVGLNLPIVLYTSGEA